MANRKDDEPEYIDDDEYFDPDAVSSGERSADGRPSDATRRGSSNVLGASGSRKDASDGSDRTGDARDDPSSGEGLGGSSESMRAQQNRPAKKSRRTKGKAAKARDGNGKRDTRKRAKGSREKPSDNKRAARDDQKGSSKRRFLSLRSPFRRKKTTEETDGKARSRDKNRKIAKLSALSGRVGNLRRRLKRAKPNEDSRAEQPARRSEGKTSKPSVRSAFGASRGDTRKTRHEMQSAGAAQGRLDRIDADEQHATPGSHTRPNKAPIFKSSEWLDLDRKLDLIGVGLVFGAIVLFFSALSHKQAAIGAVHQLIGQILGWGALAVPITMFAVGMWLIVRHFGDQAPLIDPIRLAGMIIAFVGALVLFQFGESLTYAGDSYCTPDCVRGLVESSYLGGRGGGLIGGWIYQVLVINLTEVGGFVIVAMALTFATMMITRLSMAELSTVLIGATRSMRGNMAQRAAKRRARQLQAEQQIMLAQQETTVRVSKPQAAKLSGSVAGTNALPEPSGDIMPISFRLRDMLSKRVSLLRASAEASAETTANDVRTATTPDRHGWRLFGRLFGGGDGKATGARIDTPAADHSVATGAAPKVNPARGGNWRASGDRPPPPVKVSGDKASHAQPARPPSPSLSSLRGQPPAPPMDKPSDEPEFAPSKRQDSQPTLDDFADESAIVDDNAQENSYPPETPEPQLATLKESPPTSDGENLSDSLDALDVPAEQENDLPKAVLESATELSSGAQPVPQTAEPVGPEKQIVSTGPVQRSRPHIEWQLPEFHTLLTGGSTGEMDEEVLLQQAQVIEDTLASFGAPGRVVELNTGPVITQFGVEPDYLTSRTGKRSRVKVSAIAQLDKDLQLALGAKSIRVEAPVPGKGYVGIEVPNPDSAMVSLRDVMESRSFQQIESPLAIALGMSVDGNPVSADLTQMPHLLIAGTTGSGKSKCINAIIISILASRSPDDVKFIMVDPKRVELTGYNGLPHLVAPVVVELEKTIGVLRWVTREMDERYKKFSKAGARNLVDYNHILAPDSAPMPYIVVIIDELADLMMTAPEETERAISRIAALARATGIHLVIATQRPSVDVVTGLIKANFPARIAFAVAGSVDSRVILDQPGAERLLGKGDMLYLSGNAPAPLRMQGVFVSDEEINSISRFWKLQNLGVAEIEPIRLPSAEVATSKKRSNGHETTDANTDSPSQASFWETSSQRDMTGMAVEDMTGNPDPQEDDLYPTAVEMVRRLEKASISLLQRRLRIGYTRAARLIDMMEERGIVGPPKEGSSKPRDVLPE